MENNFVTILLVVVFFLLFFSVFMLLVFLFKEFILHKALSEQENNDKKNYLNLLQIAGIMGALLFSLIQGIENSKSFEISSRPYVGFKDLEKIDFKYTYEDDLAKFLDANGSTQEFLKNGGDGRFLNQATTSYQLPFVLINHGETPAKFKISATSSYPGVAFEVFQGSQEGYIYPDQEIRIGYFLEWNQADDKFLKWVFNKEERKSPFDMFFVELRVQYAPTNEGKGQYPYFTILADRLIRSEDSKDGKGAHFAWEVLLAN